MGFIKDKLKATYASEEDSLLADFYMPVISEAVKYDRAVGYFSSSMLTFAMQGISNFVKNNGKMRLIIGDEVSDDEYEAIKQGVSLQNVYERLDQNFYELSRDCADELLKNRLNFLSWLVSRNRLEIKLAIRRKGMYHEKIGIMEDENGEVIVFHGSANETVKALLPDFNFESISVYPSWKKEIFEEYGVTYKNRFERLWKNKIKNTITVELPSEQYEKIKRIYKPNEMPERIEGELYDSLFNDNKNKIGPSLPEILNGKKYKLNEHQVDAQVQWKANDFKGIFALATGAGKTITAIDAVVKIATKSESKVSVIVSVPYQILADQWYDVFKLYNIDAIRCYKSKTVWKNKLLTAIADFKLIQTNKFIAIIVVNATLQKSDFQESIGNLPLKNMIFIGDECHHHTNKEIIKKLPKSRFRIGLSATPWSRNELDKKKMLEEYYGNIVARYDIDNALDDGVLTPYDYILHVVELTEDETEEYENLSKDIAKMYAIKSSGGDINEKALTALMMNRARLLGSAENKFEKLNDILNLEKDKSHTLIYCGDGSVELDDVDFSVRDVERAANIARKNNWKTSRFTAAETYAQRNRVLENFKFKIIDAIVAIRVLDEGFDIPACRQAYLLASSRNERQFIQRRGRILRKSPGKELSIIHDFLVIPARFNNNDYFKTMVKQELLRAIEFIRVSKNKKDVMKVAEDISLMYEIDLDEIITELELWRMGEDDRGE